MEDHPFLAKIGPDILDEDRDVEGCFQAPAEQQVQKSSISITISRSELFSGGR